MKCARFGYGSCAGLPGVQAEQVICPLVDFSFLLQYNFSNMHKRSDLMSTSSSGGNVSFNSFPATKKEFLAALYVQSQNLSGATPEEIVSMYDDAYEKVDAEFNRLREERKMLKRKENPYQSSF